MQEGSRLPALIIAAVLLAAVGAFFFLQNTDDDQSKNSGIGSYEECAAAGHPIQESFPPKCTVPGGSTYTQIIDEEILDSEDSLEVE